MDSLAKTNQKTINTDVAIVGGGIAGASASVFLQNQNIDAILIDPSSLMPKDFRCEKFNRYQMANFERLGISENIYSACTPIEDIWIARQGKLVNKKSYPHYGFSYEIAVNAIRAYLDKANRMVLGKVKSIEKGDAVQKLTLSNGQEINAKLVVLANGLNPVLRKQLDVSQTMIEKHHEMAIGFDIEPIGNNIFDFGSFTFWPERASEKLAYFTAFKSGDVFRVNTFGYWDKSDQFMSELQQQPEAALNRLMPSITKIIGEFKVTSRVHVRPVDLYQNNPEDCNGVVFIGDAYSTSCPGAGTGTSKAVKDAEILCKEYIPKWLAQDKIDAKTISQFYNNEKKLASDADSFHQAYFLKSISLEKSLAWSARRWMRFFYHLGKGTVSMITDTRKKNKKLKTV